MAKLVSWNVNGIRAALKKGFLDFLNETKPDILCLQETKAQPQDVVLDIPGYTVYWNSAVKKGYSGTAVLTRQKPAAVRLGMQIAEHDQEGRVMTLEYPDYFLVNVYTPNSKRDLSRLEYRQKWDADFLKFLKSLEKEKPVIVCGDLNVAHQEIDLTYPKANVGNHGFTPEERRGFDQLVAAGFTDAFRALYDEGGHYTWWSQIGNCRSRNIGWRIDYFCLSQALRPRLNDAVIYKDIMGSDHCPVGLLLKDAPPK